MRKIFTPVLFSFILLGAGCASSEKAVVAETEGEKYINTDHGFSIDIPTGWLRDDTPGETKDGFYFYEEASNGLVAMQIDVHNGTPKEGVALKDISDSFLDTYWRGTEITMVSEGYEKLVNNKSVYHTVFTNTDATFTPPYELTDEQWTFTHDDQLFRIQTVRLMDNEDAKQIIDEIIDSLVLFYFVD